MLDAVTIVGTLMPIMGTPGSVDTVANLLFVSVRREVLALLLSHPDERFYFRELLRAVGGWSGAVQRELKQLVDAGLVIREAAGNQVYFSANREAQDLPGTAGNHRKDRRRRGRAS